MEGTEGIRLGLVEEGNGSDSAKLLLRKLQHRHQHPPSAIHLLYLLPTLTKCSRTQFEL